MQKYILTDERGETPQHFHLEPGKHQHSLRRQSNEPMVDILSMAHDSPLLAMLEADDAKPGHCRLFMLNTWRVGTDPNDPRAYTVVKEIPVPEIGIQHKVAFAIAVVAKVFGNDQFNTWAGNWISGRDRSSASANAVRDEMKQELDAAEGLEALAAWGVSSEGDDEALAGQQDGEKRAMHVAAAASLLDGDTVDVDAVNSALALALEDIDRFSDSKELAKLADKVIQGNTSD